VAVTRPARAHTFAYDGVAVDPATHTVTCHYRLDELAFREVATFDASVDLGAPGVAAAAGLYHLLAGLSYYKAGAAHVVDLGALEVGPAARALFAAALIDGLGEFAYCNGLDLSDVVVQGGTPLAPALSAVSSSGPLIPFGGGIDSIVTVAAAGREDGAALFVVGPHDDPFEAIERPARQTGLPIVRCARRLDPAVRDSARRGWFDGHVPVTAMVSALAVVAGVARRHDAVLMSNERSSSAPTVVVDGRGINHQWSKSLACEELLREAIAERLIGGPSYASALRDRSELWVAAEFSRHDAFLGTFMSCNRAFRQDATARATTWCGVCDKCLFTDLVLSPFVSRARLEAVFGGHEPIGEPARVHDLEVLCGVVDRERPFECVGDVGECATALVAAAARADRADQSHLAALAMRCSSAATLDELLVIGGPTNTSVLDAARDLL
jgi:UDP-N-acetyl-alpha-D-muramoyl-L-alanyl-L-glutamate epimerase